MKMLSSFNWFYLRSIVKKIAGNFPAVDGPGSYDQPNRNFVSVTVIICEKVRKSIRFSSFYMLTLFLRLFFFNADI